MAFRLSGDNRNVRILATVERSAVRTLSPPPLERLAPRVVLGRTVRLLLPLLLRPAVGTRGLRSRATDRRQFAVAQVLTPEADRQAPIQPLLHHHPTAPLAGMHRRQQLVEAVPETHRVVVGHHPLRLDA